jgi:hypothetical protein
MDREIMRQRFIDLSKRGIDLVELMNLTIYNVKREIEVNAQNNFEIHFQHKEPFNNKSANTIHKLYRSDEGEAYEILSLLIRMENHYVNGRELLPE